MVLSIYLCLWTSLWFMDTPLFIAMIHVAIVANYSSYIVGVNWYNKQLFWILGNSTI